MFKGEFSFDLREALDDQWQIKHPQYCTAYYTTNEPIMDWLQLTAVQNKRVLTVAASGDQPLMYATHGAAHVDTFDMTINACAVMDFKTSALQLMDYSQYATNVQSLITLNNPGILNQRARDWFRIFNNMPERTRTLMQNIVLYRPGAFSLHNTPKISFPKDAATYTKMQEKVRTPFNFIWANLANVSNYIDGEYDIINISNIFDYYLSKREAHANIHSIIASLWPHLRSGGHLICTTSLGMGELYDILEQITRHNANVTFPQHSKSHIWRPIVIQKTR